MSVDKWKQSDSRITGFTGTTRDTRISNA